MEKSGTRSSVFARPFPHSPQPLPSEPSSARVGHPGTAATTDRPRHASSPPEVRSAHPASLPGSHVLQCAQLRDDVLTRTHRTALQGSSALPAPTDPGRRAPLLCLSMALPLPECPRVRIVGQAALSNRLLLLSNRRFSFLRVLSWLDSSLSGWATGYLSLTY